MADGVVSDPRAVWAGDGSVDEAVASALVEAAPDGMLMADEQGRILLVNRQIEVLFGYRRQDLVGQPVEVLLPERLRPVHGAHRTRFRAEPRTRTMGAGVRLWGRRADGAEFPVEISLSPLRTGGGLRVIAAVRDITARVAAETEAAHVRSVVDATRDAVLMFERDTLRFTYVNQGAVSQLGYDRHELLAMGPLHIKPTFSEGQFRALIASLSPGQSHSYTTVHRRKDGTDLPVEAVLQHPVDDRGGGSTWMVSIARDLTARLEMEQRAQAAEREVAVLEDRERIARDLHDRVIQRLFAAGLGIESLRARVSDPLLSERLTHAVGELDDTIRELRSSIFQLTLTPSSPCRRAMILDVCADERAALGFDPKVRFDGPVDTIIGDDVGDHLLAVLREALSNIARHARATTVAVTVAAVAQDLVLRVEDNGVGLPAQAARGGGNGLANMAARAGKLAGTCQLTPAHPSGTVLEWRIPLA
jgi:PAS domain S-box-containing protein